MCQGYIFFYLFAATAVFTIAVASVNFVSINVLQLVLFLVSFWGFSSPLSPSPSPQLVLTLLRLLCYFLHLALLLFSSVFFITPLLTSSVCISHPFTQMVLRIFFNIFQKASTSHQNNFHACVKQNGSNAPTHVLCLKHAQIYRHMVNVLTSHYPLCSESRLKRKTKKSKQNKYTSCYFDMPY